MKKYFAVTTFFAISVLLTSCMDDLEDDTPDVETFFTFNVSGDVTQSFQGPAGFGTFEDPDTEIDVFLIDLTSDTPSPGSGMRFVGKLDHVPGEQEFDISEASLNEENELIFEDLEPEQFIANYVTNDPEVPHENFIAEEGTLTITDRDEEYIEGEFNIQAISLPEEEDDTLAVQIEGEFQAAETDYEAIED